MLPALVRFPLRAFPDFFKQSRSKRGSFLLVRWQECDSSEPGQAAVIVAKKTFPLATQRNLVKRKLRAALFETRLLWVHKKIVVQALRKDSTSQKTAVFAQELTTLLS